MRFPASSKLSPKRVELCIGTYRWMKDFGCAFPYVSFTLFHAMLATPEPSTIVLTNFALAWHDYIML
jgi:hypothetical protein